MFENLLSVSDGDYCAEPSLIWEEPLSHFDHGAVLPDASSGDLESSRLSAGLLGVARPSGATVAGALRTYARLRFGLMIAVAAVFLPRRGVNA